jgi:histidinol-phosphatase
LRAVWRDELDLANRMADLAADIAMELFGSSGLRVRQKADRTPVTEADERIEAMIRREVARRFPGDAVLGEEEGLSGGERGARRVWVVDPIDGTKNFADGIQIWATLLALVVDGRPEVGVASAPGLGERYEAARGAGARLNGHPIEVSSVASLEMAMLVSSGVGDWLEPPLAEPFREIAVAARRTRGFGDFWGHMLVARGAAEAMLEPSLRVWDTAAVQVIVEEAGGRMTALDGSPLADRGSTLTTNGRLHDAIAGRFAGHVGAPAR